MIIAEKKRKENIVEYILYMRQIVDILRGTNLNIDIIDEHIVSKFEVSEKDKLKIHNWYQNLIKTIRDENLVQSGDLSEVKKLINEINQIHTQLLADNNEYRHKELYEWAKPNIEEFRKISKDDDGSDVEICINALYALFLLKIQKKSVSEETAEAMQTFSSLLANLADIYKKINYGDNFTE